MTRNERADGVVLRALGSLDLGIAAALHAGCFEDNWNETSIAGLLAMPGSFGVLAYVGEQPAGLVIVLSAGTEAEILTLGVLPQFRRRHVAIKLLAVVADQLIHGGCLHLSLEVAEDNVAARALYRQLGFAETGRRLAYYRRATGPGVAALILGRALQAGIE